MNKNLTSLLFGVRFKYGLRSGLNWRIHIAGSRPLVLACFLAHVPGSRQAILPVPCVQLSAAAQQMQHHAPTYRCHVLLFLHTWTTTYCPPFVLLAQCFFTRRQARHTSSCCLFFSTFLAIHPLGHHSCSIILHRITLFNPSLSKSFGKLSRVFLLILPLCQKDFLLLFTNFLGRFWKSFSWNWLQFFSKRKLDLKRLNFWVITLIPQIKDAASIKQLDLYAWSMLTSKLLLSSWQSD